MASLEYALLAEFARVDASGLMTIVGGGFVRAQPPQLPAQVPVYLAFQVTRAEDEEAPAFRVEVTPPGSQFKIDLNGRAETLVGQAPIDGNITASVAVGIMLPIPDAGKYQVRFTLGEEIHRDLYFVVIRSDEQLA